VGIDAVLGLQKRFGLVDGCIEFDPGQTIRDRDSLRLDAAFDEPRLDRNNGVLGGGKGLLDLSMVSSRR
jgi:hypothetical protein